MSQYKTVGGLWEQITEAKPDKPAQEFLGGSIDLDLTGLERDKTGMRVQISVWPNTRKTSLTAPDYRISARLSGQETPGALKGPGSYFKKRQPSDDVDDGAPDVPPRDDDIPF